MASLCLLSSLLPELVVRGEDCCLVLLGWLGVIEGLLEFASVLLLTLCVSLGDWEEGLEETLRVSLGDCVVVDLSWAFAEIAKPNSNADTNTITFFIFFVAKFIPLGSSVFNPKFRKLLDTSFEQSL